MKICANNEKPLIIHNKFNKVTGLQPVEVLRLPYAIAKIALITARIIVYLLQLYCCKVHGKRKLLNQSQDLNNSIVI